MIVTLPISKLKFEKAFLRCTETRKVPARQRSKGKGHSVRGIVMNCPTCAETTLPACASQSVQKVAPESFPSEHLMSACCMLGTGQGSVDTEMKEHGPCPQGPVVW